MADEIETTDETVETEHAEVETDEENDALETDEGDTFPREYVEQLRGKARNLRERAQAAEVRAETAEQNLDAALRELWTHKVNATGKLADADDLAFDAELLADDEKLHAAIDELVERKPHLKARNVSGNVGQGLKGKQDEPFSLMATLRRTV